MRRLLTLAALSLTLAAPVLAANDDAAKAGGARPSIEIPKMKYDFGKIFEQPTYDCSFVVRNVGTAVLVIRGVKPSCGCTAAKFDSLIAPGKEGKIALSVDGTRVHGDFEKSAVVQTNDPDHPELTIEVAGSEVPYVKIIPNETTLYLHGRYGEKVSKDFIVASNDKDLNDFKVTGLSSDIDDKITYSFAPGSQQGDYSVHVEKKTSLPVMTAFGSLVVHTNDPHSPETTLQVHVMTQSSFDVNPTTVNFGQVKFATPNGSAPEVTRSVIVSNTTGKFHIKDVSVSNPNFAAAFEPIGEGQQYRIQVTFKPPVKRQSTQHEAGELVIQTDDSMEPSLRVQLVARAM
jgi:Protein of unknown function (DUF1573)